MYFTCPNCKTDLHVNNPASKLIRGTCPHCKQALMFDIIHDGISDEEYLNNKIKATDTQTHSSKPNRKKIIFVIGLLLFVIVALVGIINIPSNKPTFTIKQTNTSSGSLANSDKKPQWSKFRKYYPYNFQTIAAKHYSDNSHVVILSEPADHISINQITEFFKSNDVNVTADCYYIPMGYDGWLKDYVFAVNNIEKGKFDIFIEQLTEMVYGTNYKSFYLDLSTLPHKTYYSSQNLNYSISAAELKSWMVDGNEKFIGKNEEEFYKISELLSSGKEGVYLSENPGFVIWVMKKNYAAEDFIKSARKFSLESDLILGAINRQNDKHIAIIGRERSLPIYELPPLQAEILLMLASTDVRELHQSYERGHAVAGKLPGGKDFAPILLSPDLWHTEYGSLLNITDQMLKSWSENGDVAYENFHYPSPNHWAFNKGVYTDLNTKNSLTYNWNTAGAGYYISPSNDCPYRIYAVNRTGSLPVSYIPEGKKDIDSNDKVFLAEERAYNYFSKLNNPELVRVVQYASFYQIMYYFKPKIHNSNDFLSQHTPNEVSLSKNKQKILTSFKSTNISKQYIMDYYDKFCKTKYGFKYSSLPKSSKDEICESAADPDYKYLIGAQNTYTTTSPELRKFGQSVLRGDELQLFNRIYDIVPISIAKEEYVRENQEIHSNWIKCPTIVLSWSLNDSTIWTGGHNLNSQITPIIYDNTIRFGEYIVNTDSYGRKEIRLNPHDIACVTPSLLRQVNRTNIKGTQHFKSVSVTIRKRNDVMKDTQRRTARGFNLVDHVYR